MPIATLNDLHFYFERAGSGRRLLYISGTGGDLRFQPNMFASPLAKAFDLLAYDQRGLGRTEGTPPEGAAPPPCLPCLIMYISITIIR